MSNFTYSDELYHFGVKGMRWGVRRYQNEDGTRTPEGKARYAKRTGGVYLRKGSIVKRVSDVDEEFSGSKKRKHAYVSYLDEDSYKYARSSHHLGGSQFTLDSPYGYQIDLKLKDDIVAPGLEEQLQTAVESVKNMSVKDIDKHFINKKGYEQSLVYKDGEDFVHDMMASNPDGTVSELQKRAYLHYSRNLMKDKKLREDFFNSLSEKGYNAVIDFNDTTSAFIDGSGKPQTKDGFSSKPLIIFDTEKTVEKVASRKIDEKMLYEQAKALHDKNKTVGDIKAIAGAVGAGLAVAPTAFVSPEVAIYLEMYAPFIGSLAGAKELNKAYDYGVDMKQYKFLMNLQKNDPVAYKKHISDELEYIQKMKESKEKEAKTK